MPSLGLQLPLSWWISILPSSYLKGRGGNGGPNELAQFNFGKRDANRFGETLKNGKIFQTRDTETPKFPVNMTTSSD